MQFRQTELPFKPIWDITPSKDSEWIVTIQGRQVVKYQDKASAYRYINTILMEYIEEAYIKGGT